MELRQVRYFVGVAEELHFGRAAERLHIVQPTVSQQVRRLEREFGLDLFDRTTRTVTLTAAGRAFLPHARALLRAERAATEAMAGLRTEQESTLRLGTHVGLGTRLDALLTALAERAPQLVVDLVSVSSATRLQQVREGELDAAFIRGVEHSPDLELLPLWRDVLVAALPSRHPLAAQREVALADLADLPLRLAPREANPHLADIVVGACRTAGFEPVMGPAFTTDQDTLAAIASGRPSWTVYYEAQAQIQPAPRVTFRPFAEPAPAVRTCLAVRSGPPSHRLTALLDACNEVERCGVDHPRHP
ncbi:MULTISPECIES: LysR family transcriptional regulator [Streptomyces]|uniref:LysR substrate-binding domain-containing protein n=1 Tax=Streptomyces TaxID=1883 RepID=UPI001E3D6022|nr:MULTISPECIES: LysR family transcriptional regulator [Streptomyces]UFQ19855.1 LysR family transcriptional regulator [Streptomyces huasconensis]WCL89478.1 LysR substrate-binding domain-containing protein [Streptomyces sp. JCM 35825]